jgi:hypothetical protein
VASVSVSTPPASDNVTRLVTEDSIGNALTRRPYRTCSAFSFCRLHSCLCSTCVPLSICAQQQAWMWRLRFRPNITLPQSDAQGGRVKVRDSNFPKHCHKGSRNALLCCTYHSYRTHTQHSHAALLFAHIKRRCIGVRLSAYRLSAFTREIERASTSYLYCTTHFIRPKGDARRRRRGTARHGKAHTRMCTKIYAECGMFSSA